MIITHLRQASGKLRYKGVAPSFVYSTQGMENYDHEKIPVWSVHVPILQDKITFDRFHEKRYNVTVLFWALANSKQELNEASEYYDAIFQELSRQKDVWLLQLDTIKDVQGRRVITVLESPEITTTYIAQARNFDAPGTAIQFNLPLLFTQFQSVCPNPVIE